MDEKILNFELENDINSEFYIEKDDFEWEPIEGTESGLKKVNNVYLPNMIKTLKTSKSLELKNDDTFVIGYPKSGTTWLEEIVWLIQNNLDFERAENEFHFTRVHFIDRGLSNGHLKIMKSPRVFKSHLTPEFLPTNFHKKSKVVYIMRNPKDMIVSTYNFCKSLKEDKYIGTFECMVNNFVNEKFWFGSWCDHVKKYYSLEEIFVTTYEDMLERPIEIIKLLVKYLEKDYTEEQIMSLIEFVSFDKMKDYKSFDFKPFIARQHFDENFTFFRKGQIGNWRKYFNEELSKKIDEYLNKNFKNIKSLKYY